MKPRFLLFLLLVVPVALAACGSSPAAASPTGGASPTGVASPTAASGGSAATQTSEGGQVTAVATWTGPAAGATFDLKLDTHSVDLDVLDLSNAVLRNDRGDSLAARPWAAAKGGHHREGTLTFLGDTSGFFAGAKWIELVLTGVGDVPERRLRWETGS
jgi:hypothetical protein